MKQKILVFVFASMSLLSAVSCSKNDRFSKRDIIGKWKFMEVLSEDGWVGMQSLNRTITLSKDSTYYTNLFADRGTYTYNGKTSTIKLHSLYNENTITTINIVSMSGIDAHITIYLQSKLNNGKQYKIEKQSGF